MQKVQLLWLDVCLRHPEMNRREDLRLTPGSRVGALEDEAIDLRAVENQLPARRQFKGQGALLGEA